MGWTRAVSVCLMLHLKAKLVWRVAMRAQSQRARKKRFGGQRCERVYWVAWPCGLVVWFSLRVREVPDSISGKAPCCALSSVWSIARLMCFIEVRCIRGRTEAQHDWDVLQCEVMIQYEIARGQSARINRKHQKWVEHERWVCAWCFIWRRSLCEGLQCVRKVKELERSVLAAKDASVFTGLRGLVV